MLISMSCKDFLCSDNLCSSLEINNAKFRKLVGIDAHPDTMERELERVIAYVGRVSGLTNNSHVHQKREGTRACRLREPVEYCQQEPPDRRNYFVQFEGSSEGETRRDERLVLISLVPSDINPSHLSSALDRKIKVGLTEGDSSVAEALEAAKEEISVRNE